MSSFDSERSTDLDMETAFENDTKTIPLFLIESISNILSNVIIKNKSLPYYPQFLKRQSKLPFNAQYIPSISINDYLRRVVTYTKLEEETLISSLIFIDRLCNSQSIILTELNIHRIIFTSVLLSIKYNEDLIFKMDYYAEICGVSASELKKLENVYCKAMEFNFYINESEFEQYKSYLYSGSMQSMSQTADRKINYEYINKNTVPVWSK